MVILANLIAADKKILKTTSLMSFPDDFSHKTELQDNVRFVGVLYNNPWIVTFGKKNQIRR